MSNVVTTKLTMAFEKLEWPSKLVKRCHNQANNGLRKVRMLELARKGTTGASLACQEPPEVALDRQG